MKKKLDLIDKIVFYLYLFLVVFSLFMAFILDAKNKFIDFKYAFNYGFLSLFKGTIIQVIVVIFTILMIITFVIIWTLGTKKIKKYSFGAIYFVSFFIYFLICNGYYNAFNHFNFGSVLLLITSIYCLISTIYSFISYYLTIKELEKIDE